MKRSLGVGEWVRRGVGVAVLAAVVAIALGADTGFLTQASLASTGTLEQSLIDKLHPQDQTASGSSVVMQGDAWRSFPPNGGFVRTRSTRSFCSQLMYGTR